MRSSSGNISSTSVSPVASVPYIPYGRQSISEADIQAVVDVLRSDFITQGPAIQAFEKAMADYTGAKYAVAVSSATAGLHIACMALGLSHDDVMWTSPITFVASANCGRYCGADVDFVDIDATTYNMGVSTLEKKLQQASESNTLPKVLIPVHLSGQSCEMEAISKLAKNYGVAVVEDASHAIGASYQNNKVGSCSFSDMTVFSFHPVKIITTAEGGIVTTNSKEQYEKLIRLRTHGVTRDPDLMDASSKDEGSWYYQQLELGYNYRMTDLQAALGVSQLSRLDTFVSERHRLVDRYNTALTELPLVCPYQHPDTYSAYHLYIIRLESDQVKHSHKEVFEGLRENGIGVNLHYIPVHTQPYYKSFGFKEGDFPESEKYYQEAISLPLYPDLTDAEQDRVIEVLRSLLV